MKFPLLMAVLFSNLSAQTIEEKVKNLENRLEIQEKQMKILVDAIKGADQKEKSQEKGTQAPVSNTGKSAFMLIEIKKKVLQKMDLRNGVNANSIIIDATFELIKETKEVRAMKGKIIFYDLFKKPKKVVEWTMNNPISPGVPFSKKGLKIPFNQFMAEDAWLKDTKIEDMMAVFMIDEMIYAK